MSLEDDFKDAQNRVTRLPAKPDNAVLLQLYSLYKQALQGDADGKRPGMMDFVARAKYDAWAALKGKSQKQAMQEYIDLVTSLESQHR